MSKERNSTDWCAEHFALYNRRFCKTKKKAPLHRPAVYMVREDREMRLEWWRKVVNTGSVEQSGKDFYWILAGIFEAEVIAPIISLLAKRVRQEDDTVSQQ